MDYCRDCILQEFYMEEEGLLFALLVKHTVERLGEDGWATAERAARSHALARGQRMAACAREAGLTPAPDLFAACLDYEDHLDRNVLRPDESGAPRVLRCGWCLGWRRYGLQQYGALYCRTMLPGMLEGFCGLQAEMTTALGFGDAFCAPALPAPSPDTLILRRAVRPLVVREFLDQCAALLTSLRQSLAADCGAQAADAITEAALAEFGLLRGEAKANALRIEADI